MRRLVVVATVAAMAVSLLAAPVSAAPAAKNVHFSGVGIPGGPGDYGCTANPDGVPTYVILMTGDLEGCIYGYELSYKELPNGIFQTRDHEYFFGTFNGKSGSWEMDEHFTSKWNADGSQKYGRCQHPIIKGTGTGDFTGVTGRVDFKDDVDLGVANYRGHVKIPNGA